MSGVSKITAERHRKLLLELLAKPGNEVCADCKARNPRWASHNLGIFICVNCASIHRKMGTHISKVKSVTLDSWTKEQVETMKTMGNLKSNAIYNSNETRYPPPPAMADPENDPELESYIRSKYQYKKFIDKSAFVALKLGPSRAASGSQFRSTSAPVVKAKHSTPPPPPPPPASASASTTNSTLARKPTTLPQLRPPPTTTTSSLRSTSQPLLQTQQQNDGVWADLISLQDSPNTSSLPLQYQVPASPQIVNHTGIGLGVNMANNSFGQPMQTTIPLATPFQQVSFSSTPQTPGFPANAFGPSASLSTGHLSPIAPMTHQFLQPQPQPAGHGLIMSGPVQQTQFSTPSPVLLSTPSPALGSYVNPSSQVPLQSPGVGFMRSTTTITQHAVPMSPVQSGMPTGFMQPQTPLGYTTGAHYQAYAGFGNTPQYQWGPL